MIDKETMDNVVQLNDFLDSIIGVVKKVAIVAAAVGAVAVATVLTIWPLVSQRPVEFAVTGVLLIVAGGFAGAAITLVATKGRTKHQIEARDRLIAAKDAEIADLKREYENRISELASSQAKPEQVRTPSGRLCVNMTAVRTLPTETVEAMLDAFDHGGVAELAAHEKWVRSSIKSKDGIFYLDTLFFMGQSTGEQTGRYRIADEWRRFMDDPYVLSEMRGTVRSAGPVWQEL